MEQSEEEGKEEKFEERSGQESIGSLEETVWLSSSIRSSNSFLGS